MGGMISRFDGRANLADARHDAPCGFGGVGFFAAAEYDRAQMSRTETIRDHGQIQFPVAAYASTAVLIATAVASLSAYRLSARFREPSPARAVAILQRWCRSACARLRLDVQVHGTMASTPRVYVANHRSYLDIPVLSATLGATFLSRADVSAWPIIGAVAREIDAVFVNRDETHARVRAARALVERVGTLNLVVFPEGTTNGEHLPRPFHVGVFRLLHRVGAAVVPVTIRYSDRRAYWTDDIGLWQHLRTRVFAGPRLVAAVHIGAALRPQEYPDGASFARAAHAAVCQPIEQLGESA